MCGRASLGFRNMVTVVIKTGAEYVNVCFRDWGHQWLYDLEELERRLREAGFTQMESVSWGESKYPELRKRETRIETRLSAKQQNRAANQPASQAFSSRCA